MNSTEIQAALDLAHRTLHTLQGRNSISYNGNMNWRDKGHIVMSLNQTSLQIDKLNKELVVALEKEKVETDRLAAQVAQDKVKEAADRQAASDNPIQLLSIENNPIDDQTAVSDDNGLGVQL